MDHDILRGKVTAYPSGDQKGLVEVTVGAYDGENATVYARAQQGLAGVYWLPELGDVVEVEIPRLPGYEARIIHIHRKAGDEQTASCWTEKNDRKQFRTRTGHTVTLDDTQDKTALTIVTAGGLTMALDDAEQTVTVHGKEDTPVLLLNMKEDAVTLTAGKKLTLTCGGATLEIDESGNISIEAKGKLELSGREITLSAQSKLSAKGQQVELGGDVSAKLSGQSQLELSSGGITQVKGGMIKLN